jgi:hypothetical protein
MNKCLDLRICSVLFSPAEIFGDLESVNLFPQKIEPSLNMVLYRRLLGIFSSRVMGFDKPYFTLF